MAYSLPLIFLNQHCLLMLSPVRLFKELLLINVLKQHNYFLYNWDKSATLSCTFLCWS